VLNDFIDRYFASKCYIYLNKSLYLIVRSGKYRHSFKKFYPFSRVTEFLTLRNILSLSEVREEGTPSRIVAEETRTFHF